MSSNAANSQERTDAASEKELRNHILRSIRPRGFHLDTKHGQPCACGAEHIRTRSKVGYSDYVTYFHRCLACGNRFRTYIEG